MNDLLKVARVDCRRPPLANLERGFAARAVAKPIIRVPLSAIAKVVERLLSRHVGGVPAVRRYARVGVAVDRPWRVEVVTKRLGQQRDLHDVHDLGEL